VQVSAKLRPWLTGVGIVAALALVVAALVGVRAWRSGSELQQAMALAPDEAGRYLWTDWAGVRDQLGWHRGETATRGQLAGFMDRAWSADLTSTSALEPAAGILQSGFGFSPATLDWELFTQTTTGHVVIGGLGDDAGAADRITARLEHAGFTPPRGGGDVWSVGAVDLGAIDPNSEPLEILNYVAVIPDRDLVVTGESASFVQKTVDGLDDGDVPEEMDTAAGALGDPLAARVVREDVACADFSLGDAGATDAAQADLLVAEAGVVTPYDALGMAVLPDGRPRDVRFALVFDDHDQAVTNADSRAVLAAGPAPLQGGRFTDLFRVREVAAEDEVVRMDLRPESGAQVMEDLGSGSVLFATC